MGNSTGPLSENLSVGTDERQYSIAEDEARELGSSPSSPAHWLVTSGRCLNHQPPRYQVGLMTRVKLSCVHLLGARLLFLF